MHRQNGTHMPCLKFKRVSLLEILDASMCHFLKLWQVTFDVNKQHNVQLVMFLRYFLTETYFAQIFKLISYDIIHYNYIIDN